MRMSEGLSSWAAVFFLIWGESQRCAPNFVGECRKNVPETEHEKPRSHARGGNPARWTSRGSRSESWSGRRQTWLFASKLELKDRRLTTFCCGRCRVGCMESDEDEGTWDDDGRLYLKNGEGKKTGEGRRGRSSREVGGLMWRGQRRSGGVGWRRGKGAVTIQKRRRHDTDRASWGRGHSNDDWTSSRGVGPRSEDLDMLCSGCMPGRSRARCCLRFAGPVSPWALVLLHSDHGSSCVRPASGIQCAGE